MRYGINLPAFAEFSDARTVTDLLTRYAAAVTWWLEGFLWSDALDAVRERIRQGPPFI